MPRLRATLKRERKVAEVEGLVCFAIMIIIMIMKGLVFWWRLIQNTEFVPIKTATRASTDAKALSLDCETG